MQESKSYMVKFNEKGVYSMKLSLIAVMAVLGMVQAGAGELNWMTDLPKAQAKAKAENKLVMLDFTGSDWCGWCIKLNKEVFSKQDFIDYANKNLVVVEVDFPRAKQQTDEQKKANQSLQEKYKIEGYPTIIVLNSSGAKVGELGYQPGGPKPFIEQLEGLKKKSQT